MNDKVKRALAIGGGVVVLSTGAFFLLGNKPSDIPVIGDAIDPEPAICPLAGDEPAAEKLAERPAIAVKIENSPAAYPLSGLEDAELVFEELVEGGMTRFMAIYHCTDSAQAGPVRSARVVDPAIATPITKILAYSGQNDIVLEALNDADMVRLDESSAPGALERIPRAGISSEHTLYADTAALRKLGKKLYSEPPPEDIFAFGDLEGASKKATSIQVNFSGASQISYEWSDGRWSRSQGGEPFVSDSGEQIAVDNVVVAEHEVVLSKTIVDPAGNPSVEIADEIGSGRAVLFRDGRAIKGTWSRESVDDPVAFETKAGGTMVFAPGSIWIHLVPSDSGEVTGSFSYAK